MVSRMEREVVYITTQELADIAKVDASTIRRWVSRGHIRPALTTPGGHHRFERDATLRALGAQIPALADGGDAA